MTYDTTNQPSKANSAFHPSGVGKWVPASAGKAKAGMVHSVSGWTRGVQIKLWDPLRTRACLVGRGTLNLAQSTIDGTSSSRREDLASMEWSNATELVGFELVTAKHI